jgi:ubiquinone/menaquinone biosynthesis C-methylase UbiE
MAAYRGDRARTYDRRWRTFTERTQAATLGLVDVAALRRLPEQLGRPLRLLDVCCGTGRLLDALARRLPEAEMDGVDASPDMLAQAKRLLDYRPNVRLLRAVAGPGECANLPYAPGRFDLLTCANALHYFPNPAVTLAGFRRLLESAGQLVLEDYTRRAAPFPWPAFEWLIRRVDPGHIRAYTLAEAGAQCDQAGLRVTRAVTFRIDWLFRGWALRAE